MRERKGVGGLSELYGNTLEHAGCQEAGVGRAAEQGPA